MTKCQLEKRNMCCCNCKYLVRVCLSCDHLGKNKYFKPEDPCVCDMQIGWACIGLGIQDYKAANEKGIHSKVNWFGDMKHGWCAEYSPLTLPKESSGNHEGIVRCENCRWLTQRDEYGRMNWCDELNREVIPITDYCSWGVKRKEVKND